jgi:hypothetical protein
LYLLCKLDRLEDIGFAGPVIGILPAAEQIDLQRAKQVIDLCALPGVERLDFVEARESSLLRDVQRERPRPIVLFGYSHANWLDRPVQRRTEAADDAS